MTEHKFQDEFIAELRMHRAYVMGVIGSMYSAGQPDLDITSIYGANSKVELKLYHGLTLPTRDGVLRLLRGPQINVITKQLWGRKCNCVILAQVAAKPDTCCIVSAQRISFDLWKNAAKILAHLPYGSYTPWQ